MVWPVGNVSNFALLLSKHIIFRYGRIIRHYAAAISGEATAARSLLLHFRGMRAAKWQDMATPTKISPPILSPYIIRTGQDVGGIGFAA